MKTLERDAPSASVNLADVYYVLFRHKWKIIFLSLAGFCVAAAIYLFKPPLYSSEAKLYVRYVLESKLPGMAGDQQIRQPDAAGANILNSEADILKSLDLALQVADVVGSEKILPDSAGGNGRYRAAIVIEKNLTVTVSQHSDVISVVFQHPNPAVVQPVLSELISAYLKKHVEIHRAAGAVDDLLSQQTDTLRSRLAQTEDELKKTKALANVISLADAKRGYTEQISKIRQELFDTEAELAERQAALKELEKFSPARAESTATNLNVPREKLADYQSVCARLELLGGKKQELLLQFTEQSSLVKSINEQIALAASEKKSLEDSYPKLTEVHVAGRQGSTSATDILAESARATSLDVKLKVLNSQLEKIQGEARQLNDLEPALSQLQTKRDLEETQYRYFSSSLEQARFDEALGAGKISNISVAQSPSPPFRESRKLLKLLAIIVAGGVGGGIGLAFVLEFYVDHTVKRTKEIEKYLQMPLLLTIPDINRNGHARPWKLVGRNPLLLKPPSLEKRTEHNSIEQTSSSQNQILQPFYEALRDRLMTNFEMRNLTHKPKLVAVTGCSDGAGTSTIAAGLAATFSETGEGNVLLVNMTFERGEAHPFYKGKLICDLDDALEKEKREDALMQENLYVVSESPNGEKLPRALPKRFAGLVPKLKASDYDYIIFDLPPVNQISITPRLAGFMDMVLLVIESEKTNREAARRAGDLLAESRAEFRTILNKTHSYVPRQLQSDF
ncbi:MAG TPA: Wzz/FepE/Etk N-terminal domain-containing protein [Verrucomicrobiae bacterium]|nr:Wzz/FepE/Etk N-terminal domain-containing protein [Verrucomicrobiae bacterium]